MPETTRGLSREQDASSQKQRSGGTMTALDAQPGEHQRVENENPYGRSLVVAARPGCRGSRPASTLPPSSGGIGHHVEDREQHVDRHRHAAAACATRSRRRPRRRRVARNTQRAAQHRHAARLLIGPAAATIMKSRRGLPQAAGVHRHRLGPADQRQAAEDGEQRQQDRPDRVDVDQRVERDAPEQPRRGIAETIGRPRVRRLVNRQRHQHDAERDELRSDIQSDESSVLSGMPRTGRSIVRQNP